LLRRHPAIHASFLDLLADIARTNAEVDRMNRSLPDGFEKIQRPEGRARGFHNKDDMAGGGAPYNYEIVRLVQCVLPSITDPSAADWPRGLHLKMPSARGLRLARTKAGKGIGGKVWGEMWGLSEQTRIPQSNQRVM
jgi:hypothetical protein